MKKPQKWGFFYIMKKMIDLVPIFLIFLGILINVNIGLFSDADTLKLLWLYFTVIPLILILIFKKNININIDKIIIASIAILVCGIISLVINKKFYYIYFYEISISIIGIIIGIYYSNVSYKNNFQIIKYFSVIFPIFLIIYSLVFISGLKYNENILFGNRNLTANILILTMPIIIYVALNKNGIIKFTAISSIVFSFLSILIYFPSRFAMIVSALLVFGYIIIQFKKNKSILIIIAGLSFLLIMAMIYKHQRFQEIISFIGYDDRLIVWKIALKAISEKYIIGYGLGQTSQVIDNFRVFEQDYSIKMDATEFIHLHNDLLQNLLEGGAFGLVAYLIFIFLIFFKIHKLLISPNLNRSEKSVIFTLLICIIVSIIHSMVDIPLKSPINRALFYILIGLVISIDHEYEKI